MTDTALEPYKPGLEARKARALQVMALVAEGKSVDEACYQLGIVPDTFHRWMMRPEIGAVVDAALQETTAAARLQIAEALPKMLERQIALATGDGFDIKPRDQTAAFRAVTETLTRLQPIIRVVEPEEPELPELPVPAEVEKKEDLTEQPDPEPPLPPFAPTFLGPTTVHITQEKTTVVDSRGLPDRSATGPGSR